MSRHTALKIARKASIIARNPVKLVTEFSDRPGCQTPGCDNLALRVGRKKDGSPVWRKWCSKCHNSRTAAKHGLKSIDEITAKKKGFNNVVEYKKNLVCEKGFKNLTEYKKHLAREKGFKSYGDYQDHLAREKGFKNHTHYKNSKHPYLKYRKDYCENIDARLGFACTTTIFWEGMLDVDHKNGKPKDNRKANLQTLCKCCHAYKSNKEKDYLTPGRKALGMSR